MERSIRKVLFGDLFNNIQAYEEYFSEMSRKGLHLQKMGRFFAYFRKGEPDNLNYRIDIVKKDEKETKIRNYQREGWKFVGEKELLLIFSSTENSKLKELYETPETQRLALNDAKNEILGENNIWFIVSLIGTLFIILITYQRAKLEGGFFLLLTKEKLILPIVFALISFFNLGRKRWHINRIMKKLESNEFLSHYGDYSLVKSGFIIRNMIYILIIFSLFYKLPQDTSTNLSDIETMGNLPIINIADIETMDYSRRDSSIHNPKNAIDYGNFLYESWNPLVPKEYSLIETVIFENSNSNGSDAQLLVDYYLGRFDNIAKGLEDNILTREEHHSLRANKILEEDDFVCYGVKKETFSVILCRKGKQVVFVRYYDGTASLDEIVQAIVEKLQHTQIY